MSWDNGPWAIEGGQTSADVGRLVAWHAVGGYTGIGQPTDLAVRALDVPGGQVRVMPGTCSVPTKALGKSFQVYVGSNPTEDLISIPSTGSSGGRSDLIVARVENPINGEPWDAPEDPLTGQYIFTRRYPNVSPSTTHVNQVDPSASAVTLARIDIPANTGTITQGMIVDLRKPQGLAADVAENKIWTAVSSHTANPSTFRHTHTSFISWPSGASWPIPIPRWATLMDIDAATVNAEQQIATDTGQTTGHIWGEMRVNIGNGALVTAPTEFDQEFPLGSNGIPNLSPTSVFLPAVGSLAIPSALRGTTQTFRLEVRMYVDNTTPGTRGKVVAGRGCNSKILVNFKSGAVY